jgi:hypothetical protein
VIPAHLRLAHRVVQERAALGSGGTSPFPEHHCACIMTQRRSAGGPRRLTRLPPGPANGRATRRVVPLRPPQTLTCPDNPRTVKPCPGPPRTSSPASMPVPTDADMPMTAGASHQSTRASKHEKRKRIAPTGMPPRLLSRGEAASYCGVSAIHVAEHVASKVPPSQLGGRKLWDIRSLDQWLDQQSGLIELVQPIDDWLESLGK